MKILFLSHYFPPEVNAPANRTYDNCKIWAKSHKVMVITNFPNHPIGKIFQGYKNKLYQVENIDGIEVHRVLTFVARNEGFFLRTLNYIFYMINSIIYVLVSKLEFDVVIATSPQFFCGLAGKYISIIKKKPFVLELRDLWPDSILAVGAIKTNFIIKILRKIEIGLYNSAKKIISVTRSFKEDLVKKGIEGNKIEIIYNGISEEFLDTREETRNLSILNFLNDGFKIGYIGTVGMAHALGTLVEAAEILKNENVKFIIVGSGAEEEKIKRMIFDKGLKNIAIYPMQPRNEIPSIIERLDLFCVHLKNTPLFETVIPSKIFEAMILKKCILMGVKGEALEILLKADCCIPFEPENPMDLSEKILYARDNISIVHKKGINGYDYVIKNFNRTKLAEKYLCTLENLVM